MIQAAIGRLTGETDRSTVALCKIDDIQIRADKQYSNSTLTSINTNRQTQTSIMIEELSWNRVTKELGRSVGAEPAR